MSKEDYSRQFIVVYRNNLSSGKVDAISVALVRAADKESAVESQARYKYVDEVIGVAPAGFGAPVLRVRLRRSVVTDELLRLPR